MSEVQTEEQLECIQSHGYGENACNGAVEHRMPLSGSGRSFPRCAKHWDERLELEDGLRARYPVRPPADWSPLDAGEHWDEEDY